VSNGCINFNIKDITQLGGVGVATGTKIFVLPDNPTNKFQMIDGRLRFISSEKDVNKTVKSYAPLKITLKAEGVNSQGKEFLQAVSENKERLMKLYPTVSNDIYNQISKIAYGIFGQESSFGTFGGVRGKLGFVKDELASTLTDKDVSVGVTQIRFSSVNSKTRKAFDINSTLDLKNDNTKAAIATMSLLLDLYENQIPNASKKNFKELLPLGYSNRSEFAKGVKGNVDVFKNKYVENVTNNGQLVSIFLGSENVSDVAKNADKILTTEDLLKQKIQDGEIIKKCK